MLSEPPADKVPRFRPRKVTHDELFLISYFVDLKVDPATENAPGRGVSRDRSCCVFKKHTKKNNFTYIKKVCIFFVNDP